MTDGYVPQCHGYRDGGGERDDAVQKSKNSNTTFGSEIATPFVSCGGSTVQRKASILAPRDRTRGQPR